jgi:hypothetical protein
VVRQGEVPCLAVTGADQALLLVERIGAMAAPVRGKHCRPGKLRPITGAVGQHAFRHAPAERIRDTHVLADVADRESELPFEVIVLEGVQVLEHLESGARDRRHQVLTLRCGRKLHLIGRQDGLVACRVVR